MAYNKERYRTLKMVAYYMLLTIWYLLSLLPLWVHYLLSDLLYLIVYKIFGYRKAVVKSNLATSFPEKSKDELLKIERGFYHFLGDGRKRETDDHQQEELEKKIGVQRY